MDGALIVRLQLQEVACEMQHLLIYHVQQCKLDVPHNERHNSTESSSVCFGKPVAAGKVHPNNTTTV